MNKLRVRMQHQVFHFFIISISIKFRAQVGNERRGSANGGNYAFWLAPIWCACRNFNTLTWTFTGGWCCQASWSSPFRVKNQFRKNIWWSVSYRFQLIFQKIINNCCVLGFSRQFPPGHSQRIPGGMCRTAFRCENKKCFGHTDWASGTLCSFRRLARNTRGSGAFQNILRTRG